MSRQELADAINTAVFRSSGGTLVTVVDSHHVGKWERGDIRWPAAHYRAALRAIMDVPTDGHLGFTRGSRGKVENVDRATFLKTALGASAGALLRHVIPAADGSGADLLSAVAGPTAHYRRMEQSVSSAQLVPAVEAHLALATGIVTGALRNASGYQVLAEVSGLAAWLALDRSDVGGARRRYADAVKHSARANHPLLISYQTASLGQLAIESGDARHGVALLDRAAIALDSSAPSTARAWLACLHAVGYASMGDRTATHAALRTAERATSRKRGEPLWPWVFAVDHPKTLRYQAVALARLGDLRGATTAFDAALPTLIAPKTRAPVLLDQARMLSSAGQIDAACALAIEAFRIGRDYGSERITARVRSLRATLPDRTADVESLDDELTGLYDEDMR
jgi:tetratricopeptide (TPR) repeat protein